VTAEVIKQTTGVGNGIRPPIADVNSAYGNRHSSDFPAISGLASIL